ncbi:WbqC-like protein family protein [Spirosomataceae bacterium TFI 002]|nr:WbqC-like protein family protein [Spirosomataceae bacterium TFI 002]
MKLAIMQPYIFPYLGYYQLVNLADTFYFYDDVNFIKKGWINKNNILNVDKPLSFTIPLQGASQNKLINEIETAFDRKWLDKFYKTLEQSYKKAPFYEQGISLVKKVMEGNHSNVAELAANSVVEVANFLGFETVFKTSSIHDSNQSHKAQERILAMALAEGANHYINPIGGQEIYDKELFASNDVKLNFIKANGIVYSQFKEPFVPYLSVIDALMFLDKKGINDLMPFFELV